MNPETQWRDAWQAGRPAQAAAPPRLLDAWDAQQRDRSAPPSARARAIAGWLLLIVLAITPRFGRAEATDHYLAQTLRECARPLALWIEIRLEKGHQ